MGIVKHELKCWPPHFEHVLDGRKTFEARSIADRHFSVGDTLLLREYDGSLEHREPETGGYTGRTCERQISYMLGNGDFGVKEGFVVLALSQPSSNEEKLRDALVTYVGEWALGLLKRGEATTDDWKELRQLVQITAPADTDDLCTCGHVRHEHHTWNENASVGCAFCPCEQFHLDLAALREETP